MSHFTVGIITYGKPSSMDIDFMLEPFDENKSVRHIIKKKNIIENVRTSIKNYEKTAYKEYLENPELYKEKYGANQAHIKYISEIFPKKLHWTDEECYKEGIEYEDEKNILPNGDLVSYYNPQSKWDWYEIGGRWDNLLITKNGACNSARIKDILNRYNKEKYKEAEEFWDSYVVRGESQEGFVYNRDYYLTYYGTKKNYATCMATLSTYAVIDEYGDWHGKGEMGWFGMSNQTETAESDWAKWFNETLDELKDEDYWLTIVDCHI